MYYIIQEHWWIRFKKFKIILFLRINFMTVIENYLFENLSSILFMYKLWVFWEIQKLLI